MEENKRRLAQLEGQASQLRQENDRLAADRAAIERSLKEAQSSQAQIAEEKKTLGTQLARR